MASPWSLAAAGLVVMTASGVGGNLGMVAGFRDLVDWSLPHTLFTISKFTLSTNILMNVPMIAMITQIPVVMSVTISNAVFVKTIIYSNHLLKLEIMIAASWLLASCVFVVRRAVALDPCLIYDVSSDEGMAAGSGTSLGVPDFLVANHIRRDWCVGLQYTLLHSHKLLVVGWQCGW